MTDHTCFWIVVGFYAAILILPLAYQAWRGDWS